MQRTVNVFNMFSVLHPRNLKKKEISQRMIRMSKVSFLLTQKNLVNNARAPGLRGLLLNYACHILPACYSTDFSFPA